MRYVDFWVLIKRSSGGQNPSLVHVMETILIILCIFEYTNIE